MLGRGGKEGNNAFTHDEDLRDHQEETVYVRDFLERDPTPEMMKAAIMNKLFDEDDVFDNIYVLVRRGNINCLKAYMRKAEKSWRCGFNRLYPEAVEGKIEGRINRFSVVKKPKTNMSICPLHVACV